MTTNDQQNQRQIISFFIIQLICLVLISTVIHLSYFPSAHWHIVFCLPMFFWWLTPWFSSYEADTVFISCIPLCLAFLRLFHNSQILLLFIYLFIILLNSVLYIRLSILPTYYIPKDGTLHSYKEFISLLPGMDHPEAFGQHPNADITSQIQETRRLFETLLSLQPAVSTGTGESREDIVWNNVQTTPLQFICNLK